MKETQLIAAVKTTARAIHAAAASDRFDTLGDLAERLSSDLWRLADYRFYSDPAMLLDDWIKHGTFRHRPNAAGGRGALLGSLPDDATVGDLCKLKPGDIQRIKGIGPVFFRELTDALAEYGLSLS